MIFESEKFKEETAWKKSEDKMIVLKRYMRILVEISVGLSSSRIEIVGENCILGNGFPSTGMCRFFRQTQTTN
jgi:hypothetical protein